MSHAFARIAFTPAVCDAQARDGSRERYARAFESGVEIVNASLGERERTFLAERRSFYMATVSETGWPYVQHRGGPRGFLQVIDDRTLAFADFAGNRQFISAGNASGNDRVALIVVDYAERRRLKLLGHLRQRAFDSTDALATRLIDPDYRATPQRIFIIDVEAYDWNCPQHIPQLLDADEVAAALAARDARITALEHALAQQAPSPSLAATAGGGT